MDAAPLPDCGAPGGGRAVWIRACDGVRLRLAHWPGRRTLLILPGRTEHIEKYGPLVGELSVAGWGALVVDWRGQGLSDRLGPDPRIGDVADFADYQRDLGAVRDWVARHLPGPLPVLSHSMGGCILMRALAGGWHPPAVALAAPMLGLPLAAHLRAGVRILATLARPLGLDRGYAPQTGPEFGLASMDFAGNKLTGDPEQFARMRRLIADPALHIGGPSLRWTNAALAECRALVALPAPDLPAMIGLGGQDRVIDPAPVRELARRWRGCRYLHYAEARHELLMETPAVRGDFLRQALALFARSV